jgi:hypothetical protein
MTNMLYIRRGITARAACAMQALSGVRMVGSAATMGYCAIHLATTHKFSPMIFGSAVMFGAVAAVTASLLSGCLTSSRSN